MTMNGAVLPIMAFYIVTAEEQVTWGGINNVSRWDQDLVRERKRQDMRGKGLGLICHFLKVLRARGVMVLTDQHVERLAVENQRVAGVVMRSGETIRARKGVILATGTYSANPQMSWEFEQLPGVAQEASSLAPVVPAKPQVRREKASARTRRLSRGLAPIWTG